MSEREGPGVAKRLRFEAVRISSQHEKLNQLYAEFRQALARRARHSAVVAFGRFRDALEAHFEVEDRLYFPAVHGIHPGESATIDALSRDHEAFLHELASIERLLGADEIDESAERVAALVAALILHEQQEEAMLARVSPPKRATDPVTTSR